MKVIKFSYWKTATSSIPAVFEAIAQAQQKIILETFILFEDEVGKKLHAALLKAAQRGVKAEVLLRRLRLSRSQRRVCRELTSAGVIFRYYDPRPRLLGLRTNIFRRMHRKIVVIDDRIAFVGGINYSAEHMSDYGPQAKQDYAVRVEGPVVADILQFEVENLPGQKPCAPLVEAPSPGRRKPSPRRSAGAVCLAR
ncbi:phospholipase [Salmonella enterica subsp. enterica]|uniref:Phospholipase n=1 Tax=Salmonella enterica I TaxID=59201 RepID=A0A379WWZ0_SALET|nr:phospholipase [Salmonella enterica subsp. enterica]